MDAESIRSHLRRLGATQLAGANGPYTDEEVRKAELAFGTPVLAALRLLLTEVGGSIGFDTGVVLLGERGPLQVRTLFGLGRDDYDARDMARAYVGQVPRGWIPIADDDNGYFYCVAPGGEIHYIELEERFWARPECPEVPPPGSRVVANSVEQFLLSLALPLWARTN